jgi:hypothetical protein
MLNRFRHWLAKTLTGDNDDHGPQRDLREAACEAGAPGIPRAMSVGAEKMRLHEVVGRCVKLIIRDRQRILGDLDRECRATSDDVWAGRRENQFMAMPSEELAARLWDSWSEDDRDGIVVESGYYIVERKLWFRVSGKPADVEEPSWSYVIDPFPVGVTLYDQIFEPAPRIRVVEPMSPDSRLYSAVGGVVRPVPKAD